jgi:threonyl-tRNA synthetase
MSATRIILPDNSEKHFDHPPTVLEVAESISQGLARVTVAGQLNKQSQLVDLRTVLNDGTQLKIITTRDEEANEVIRHSAAHVLAQAVQELWPEVKVTFGPATDEGFFYDFDSPRPFEPDDLVIIEKKMDEIIRRNAPIVREEWEAKRALKTFQDKGERFKAEHIERLNMDYLTIYHQGDWFDLCSGPHVQSTGQIKAIKLLSIAGAYWRGDENNPQLQRVYGTAFTDKKALAEYLERQEEAKRRDHRRLGKELGLFYFHPVTPGAPFFTGKGAIVYNELQSFLRELYRELDYQEVITPQIYDVDLYHRSGHYENYRENMYFTEIDDRQFSVKPMNCPGHCVLYAMEHHSYRELPIRLADFGRLHRYERSGAMHGLTRVRSFCQDDAHIFCRIDQMQTEIEAFMGLLDRVYQQLGMVEYKIFLSTRPEKRMGSDEIWDQSEKALADGLENMGLSFTVNPGDGAFYGPKLDIMFVDALKRPWQLGTLQCDFNMPENFDLKYVGEDNKDHRPVMLHRAVLGSLERFIGVYLEHCAGKLPLWLAPEQVRILSVTERQETYCRNLYSMIKSQGVRVHFDERGEKLGFKIREAQLAKVPYMLIIGDKEVENQNLSLRLRDGSTTTGIELSDFLERLGAEVNQRLLKSPFNETDISNQEECD